MATDRQVEHVGIEELFCFYYEKNLKVDLSSDEVGCSPLSTESDSNSDQDSNPHPTAAAQP